MKIITDITQANIEDVKRLYDQAFNDEIEYREELFNSYLKNAKFFGVTEKNKLVMMTFFVPKRIFFLNDKRDAYLIFAVAVDKDYQNKGLMSKYLNKFIDDMNLYSDYIFIQSHNWDIYRNFDFLECTKLSKWTLRKDQFLKVDNISEKINYELINKININFLRAFDVSGFTYMTEKENKKYHKLYLKCGYQIIMSHKSYLIYSPQEQLVEKFAYLDLKDFIKLVSSLPYGTKINSYFKLDKRFFVPEDESTNFVKTKIFNNKKLDLNLENLDIYFLDNW